MAKKIGRNDPCPCGSGKKYKRCCGFMGQQASPTGQVANPDDLPEEVRRAIFDMQIKEQERIQRFGHGRPIISVDHQGYKFVAVGGTLHYSKSWKTFHDFLINYMSIALTPEWGNAELRKPFEDRHPIIQWYWGVCDLQRETIKEPGKAVSTPATGPTMAYLALAYDLYTLAHHGLLQTRLIRRLKNKVGFQGARYETYVCATFVRAGFEVSFEDEGDPTRTHCEFTAKHLGTGAQFSIEAKSRHRPGYLGQSGDRPPLEKIEADIYKLVQEALLKQADHPRIIFIDTNVPPEDSALFESQWFKRILGQLEQLESRQRTDAPWPSAFVIFTNHPYHYVGSDEPEPGRTAIMTAINIPDFKQPDSEVIRRKYPEINQLFDSVVTHTTVPHEFS